MVRLVPPGRGPHLNDGQVASGAADGFYLEVKAVLPSRLPSGAVAVGDAPPARRVSIPLGFFPSRSGIMCPG